MKDQGIGSWIERRARSAPERPALISDRSTLTNAELARRVRLLAHGLRGLGVGHGDRVAWLGENHAAFLDTLFATAALGAVMAPVNHRLDPTIVGAVLADCEPKVVVEASPPDSAPASGAVSRVVVGGGPDGAVDFEELLSDAPDDPIDEAVGLDDLCMIPHTSGTTGIPKGVMLTHGNVTWNAINMLSSTDLRSDDVTIAIAPFFRVGGTGVNVLPVLFAGGSAIVPASPAPEEILRLIGQHRVTVGFGNPDLLAALVRSPHWPGADLSSVRYFLTGGASVPEGLLRAFLDRGVPCLQGYGLSEAGPVVMILAPEHALDRVGSAGRPVLMADVQVVRPDGTRCAAEETGELTVQGPNIMAGYWRRPDATAVTLDASGWLRTGDAARVDDQGFYWIVDRMKDAYVTPGGTVFPADIDRVLLEHPGIEDAAAVGVPAGPGISATSAFVVRHAGDQVSGEDVLAYCRGLLPEHACPTSIRFVLTIPRNSVGKVLRDRLRAL